MLCRRMRLTERHLQPPREPLEGPIVRPCTARKLLNLDTAPLTSTAHTITIPTGDEVTLNGEGPAFSPRGRKAPEPPKTPLMIVNLNIPPGTETLAPKGCVARSERHKLPHFCIQQRQPGRLCSAPASCGAGPVGSGTGPPGLIPQIFIQSFELQDRRATDGAGGPHQQQDGSRPQDDSQCNLITENEEDTFATLLLDNISNISLEMIQRHQQKLLGTAASSMTEGPPMTTATTTTGPSASAGGFQHAEGCSSMDRSESKTSTEGLLPLDGRIRGQSAGPSLGRSQDGPQDDPNSDIPAGYRSLCYRTPSPKTRQIIRVDIVTSREKD
ncbi:uncharacterized protein LOC128730684 [Anopheles nili]|uniref:uncharacterized protein LOC128730684 n=1 Tax=Anopheles nili TaxID=185578 RepID=UPI00237AB63F|nr:uncharacterized protein LOC128730684 [Anopheles nili]